MSGVSSAGAGDPRAGSHGPPPVGGHGQRWPGVSPPVYRYGPPVYQPYPPRARPVPPRGGVPRWVGWLLAVPFLVGWLVWLVLPTLQTIVMSFEIRSVDQQAGGLAFDAGARNYGALGADGFWSALGDTAALAVVPVLVIGVVAPLLAFAVNRGSSGVRMAARLVLTVPVAGFAPAIVLRAWLPIFPVSKQVPIQLITALAWLGLLCGIGLAVYLAALRRRDQDTLPPLPAGQAVRRIGPAWALVAIGTLAFGLQAFTLNLPGGKHTVTAQL